MQFVIEINEKDVFPDSEYKADRYTLRRGVNTVLINEKKEIALLHSENGGYYILPGGKIEEGESLESALTREVQEEVGCDIKTSGLIGTSIMYEEKLKIISIYHCFLASVSSEINESNFTEGEKNAGFKLEWLNIDKALVILSEAKTSDYIGSFLLVRERAILEESKGAI